MLLISLFSLDRDEATEEELKETFQKSSQKSTNEKQCLIQ